MNDLITEQTLFKTGCKRLAGIDEAGRGPLAGPVVAACITIDNTYQIKNEQLFKVNDSKKLTAKQRDFLFDLILEEFEEIGIGIVDNEQIDRLNILQANFLAMRTAVSKLKTPPDYVLVDGNLLIPDLGIAQKSIIKGDGSVFLIAAASIVAKVTRDRIMQTYDSQYPEYNFKQHKGYGTKLHLLKLAEFGPSAIHRRSFEPIKSMARTVK